MVRPWQLWLSPRPIKRTETPVEPIQLSWNDAALYEYLYEDGGRFVVRETHYASSKHVQEGASGPPLHIHTGQTEYFRVLQGKLSVIKNGKQSTLGPDDGVYTIERGSRHRFWAHPDIKTTQEDLKFLVWTNPQDVEYPFDENFLRNLIGYLRDCIEQGMEPSLFQMALLGWSSHTIFPCPPFYTPIWFLEMIQYVLGCCIGQYVLGYLPSYPEYNTKPRDDRSPYGTKKTR